MAAIECDGLTKYYGDVRGIEDLSFTVDTGEVFGFLGPNGAGKTTTIRTLMGFQSPSSGGATVLGSAITDRAALRETRADIGYLPDDVGFEENVTGRRLLNYHAALKGDVRSDDMLELFDPPLDRKVAQYSSGNKQMLAIIIAFMHDPDLLIMDEPTSGLDPLKQERLLEFIRAEQQRGKTFFFSSHILSEVRKICDRVGIIRDGHLVELEAVESLLDRSGKTVRIRLGGDVEPSAFDLAGAHDIEITGDAGAEESGTTVSFTYTGQFEPLLETILEYDILDVNIEEAPLDEVFMRFYGEDPSERVDTIENGGEREDV